MVRPRLRWLAVQRPCSRWRSLGWCTLIPVIGDAAIAVQSAGNTLFMLACELPVLMFALISVKYLKWAFWVGWAINLLFALFVGVIVVWLEFFWQW